MKRCLIIVDMLNDFVSDGGALRVEGAEKLIPIINEIKGKFDKVVFACDSHLENDKEFDLFPKHCVSDTWGAKIVDGIKPNDEDFLATKVDLSCFTNPDVHKYLLKEKIDEVVVVGVATEYCVRGAVIDALKLGFKVKVVVDAIAGVDINTGDQFKALIEMGNNGAVAVNACDIM